MINKIIIFVWTLIIFLNSIIGAEHLHKHTDFLLCRLCGYNIAPATHVINIRSPAAEEIVNLTLFGLENVEVQRLRNVIGIEFRIVITSGSTCVGRREVIKFLSPISDHTLAVAYRKGPDSFNQVFQQKWKSKHSWFPGYSWKPCYCIHCSSHIGWIFEPIASAHEDRAYASTKGFYALILDNLISEDYSNSLVVSPKISSHQEL